MFIIAGATLLTGDLNGIVRALSRATMRNIRQDLFFAFIYNAASVPCPVFRLILSAIIAAAAMAASPVSFIAYALRLRSVRI